MNEPPGGPPPVGPEPPDDPPPGTSRPEQSPATEEWRPPDPASPAPSPYGPPLQYGPPQGPPPGYGPAPYGAPPPGAPPYGQAYAPPYGQPQYGQPQYGQPQYGQPPYGQPPYGQPPYGQPYGQPVPARGRRGLVIGVVAGFVVLVVCVAVTAVLVSRDRSFGKPAPLPSGVTAAVSSVGTVTIARAGVTIPIVDVYEDFQCPICKEFHRVNDATLKSLVAEGRAMVVYHPIVIFNSEPLSGNSLRASAAAHCITDGTRWLAFQDQLFLHQPPEGSVGFSTTDLVSYGKNAGIDDSRFGSCVRSQRYAAEVRQTSQAAISGGLFGTPTVNVDGRSLPTSETLTVQGLRNAIIAAG